MPIRIMEGSNLFCGSAGNSLHLELTELALPPLEEIYQDFHPGGSPVQHEVGLGIQKFNASFKLAGWNEQVLALFGLGATVAEDFSAYGSIKDKQTGVIQSATCIMTGRLGKVEPEGHQRGELQHHDYAIREISHYELLIEGAEIYYWDFFSTEWRVNGAAQNAEERNALRIT